MSRSFWKKLLEPLGWLVLIFLAVSLVYLAYNTYWAHSEIWSAASSKFLFFPEPGRGGAFYKPVFNFFLGVIYLLTERSWDLYETSRIFFSMVAIGILVLQFWVAQIFFNSRRWALFSVLATASSYLFLSRGFRIRSDVLATFFGMMSLGYLTLLLNRFDLHRKHIWVKFILSLGFMLGATPKSVILLIVLIFYGVSLFYYRVQSENRNKFLFKVFRWLGAGLFTGFVVVSCGVWLIYGKSPFDFLKAPWSYFVRTLEGADGETVTYLSIVSFMYLKKALQENSVFFFILYFSWFSQLLPSIRAQLYGSLESRIWVRSTFLLFTLFCLFPDKLPFYLASMIPFFALAVTSLVFEIFHRSRRWSYKFQWMRLGVSVIMIGIVLVQGLYFGKPLILENHNKDQKRVMLDLHVYFEKHKPYRVYTGMGLFSKENEYMEFLGPGLGDKKKVKLQNFEADMPVFVIKTQKLDILEPEINFVLKHNYIGFAPGLYVRTVPISSANATYPWPSRTGDAGRKENYQIVADFPDLLNQQFGESVVAKNRKLYFIKQGENRRMSPRSMTFRSDSGKKVVFPNGIVDLDLVDSNKNGELYFENDNMLTWYTLYPYPGDEVVMHPHYTGLFYFDGKY